MKYLITGGAGFIGTNFSHHLLSRGDEVIIFDNFSKKGCRLNLSWLNSQFSGNQLSVLEADITKDTQLLTEAISSADVVFHLAAQTAVTTSVSDPRSDLQANILGTFNVLESVRQVNPGIPIIFSSTNKVYGALENISLRETANRYFYFDLSGISENQLTDFYSPYGCSKGSADQYVRDYSRIYSLKTVVFRQSCIYGPHQFGVEDQGWLAWFVIAVLLNKPITIFGNGKQTRDALFVDDLFRAWDLATKNINQIAGQIYNIGGGVDNSVSLKETIKLLEKKLSKKIQLSYSNWRPGDQKIFISDNSKLLVDLAWQPKIDISVGLDKLISWAQTNITDIEKMLAF